jgi:hypothetical protein
MRPSHPLPAPSSGRTLKPKSTSKKTKKTGALDVPTRARVRVIDPRLYEPVHLREGLLEAIVDSHVSQPHTTHPNPSNSKSTPRTSVPKRTRSASLSSSVSDATRAIETDVLRDVALSSAVDDDPEEGVELPGFEKGRARDLHLLSLMFGDDESQWGGKESVEDEPSEVQLTPSTEPTPETASSLARPKSKMLKDLFQPHAEERVCAFCVVVSRNLINARTIQPDFHSSPAWVTLTSTSTSTSHSTSMPTPPPSPRLCGPQTHVPQSQSHPQLWQRLCNREAWRSTLRFPCFSPTPRIPTPWTCFLWLNVRDGSLAGAVTREFALFINMPQWLSRCGVWCVVSSHYFPLILVSMVLVLYVANRTADTRLSGYRETIRRRWDETKGALTREWKKRAREAVKLRKRRYGAQGGEDA